MKGRRAAASVGIECPQRGAAGAGRQFPETHGMGTLFRRALKSEKIGDLNHLNRSIQRRVM